MANGLSDMLAVESYATVDDYIGQYLYSNILTVLARIPDGEWHSGMCILLFSLFATR